MSARRYSRWLRRFARAVEKNREIDARAPITPETDPELAASSSCAVLRRRGVRYWFKRDGTVASWDEVVRRGHGACSEAAALATALALNRGAESVALCVEEHPRVPSYAHVAVYVGGRRVDCFADRSLVVGSCRYRFNFGPEGLDRGLLRTV